MADDTKAVKRLGPPGVPSFVVESMIRNGIDPRARFVDAADGWRYGDSHVDVSAPEFEQETLDLAAAAVTWIDEQLGLSEGERDPAASVLELSQPTWFD